MATSSPVGAGENITSGNNVSEGAGAACSEASAASPLTPATLSLSAVIGGCGTFWVVVTLLATLYEAVRAFGSMKTVRDLVDRFGGARRPPRAAVRSLTS